MKVKININNADFIMEKNYTILQSCLWIYRNKFKDSIFEIPRFCFHEKLSIAGNCRMCLVEVKKSPKPVASCAMPIMENMVIKTNTSLVKKAREAVLEFILANHPLDCPICDQGGECDLQDQSMIFGGDIGRFYEYKRAVEDKECGPFVKTVMTRCIHCTRCVRFLSEVSGTNELGVLGRGSKMEIGTYLSKFIKTEVSGNIIDLCPVGALTSKPYTFTARSWELITKQTIDILDNIGSDIRVDLRGTEVMRILPRYNEYINDMWISDITRFFYDSIKRQRLWIPMFKNKNSFFISCSWEVILKELWSFFFINNYILKRKLNYHAITGNFTDAKSLIILKNYSHLLNYKINTNSINNSFKINQDFRQNFLVPYSRNTLKNSDCIILLGLNLRLESPIYNLFIRKLVVKYNKLVISCNTHLNLNYYIKSIGINILSFINLLEGRNAFINLLNTYQNIIILLGNTILKRIDNNAFFNLLNSLSTKFKFGVIQKDIGSILSSELGLYNNIFNYHGKNYSNINNNNNNNLISEPINYYFNLGNYNSVPFKKYNQFVLFQGHHGSTDSWFKNLNVVLPSKSFLEQNAEYLNFEGVTRFSKNILMSQKYAKNDYKILNVYFWNKYFNVKNIIKINLLNIYIYNKIKYFNLKKIQLINIYIYYLLNKNINIFGDIVKSLGNYNYLNSIYKLIIKYLNKYNYNEAILNFLDSSKINNNIYINYPIFKQKFINNNNNILVQTSSFKKIKFLKTSIKFSNYPFKNYLNNFYSYDIFSKSSLILTKAEKAFKKTITNYI